MEGDILIFLELYHASVKSECCYVLDRKCLSDKMILITFQSQFQTHPPSEALEPNGKPWHKYKGEFAKVQCKHSVVVVFNYSFCILIC